MRIELQNETGYCRVNASFIGATLYLTAYQIRRVKHELGVMTKENSDGIGDPGFEWVRNMRERGWNGALFRKN